MKATAIECRDDSCEFMCEVTKLFVNKKNYDVCTKYICAISYKDIDITLIKDL